MLVVLEMRARERSMMMDVEFKQLSLVLHRVNLKIHLTLAPRLMREE